MIKFENLTTGETLILGDNLDYEYMLAHADFGTVKGESNTTQYIDLIGSHVDSTALVERDIAFVGIIKTESKGVLLQRKTKLKKFFNPQNEIAAYYKGYALIFKPSETVRDSQNKYENCGTYYRFTITGIAHDPLFKLQSDSVLTESTSKGVALFPLVIPANKGFAFGFIPATSVNNVPNYGDVETGFVMRMTATEGNVTNPKITNNKTGEFIEVIMEMTQGDIIEISTVNGNKYAKMIRGEAEIDIFKFITTASTMSMKLQVGVNDLSISAAGNATNLANVIKYSPRWLEVV